MITLTDVKRKVEKFRWENKKKSYEGDLQDLKSLYWHIVAHEILGNDKQKSNNWEYQKDYLGKIVTTYSGIFFWSFKIEYALKKKFDGLRFSIIKREKKMWNEWIKEVDNNCDEIFKEIIKTVRNALGNRHFMDLDYKLTDRPFNSEAFSTHYTNKTISVSYFLKKHYLNELNTAKIPELPIIYFKHSLKDKLVERLHRFGERLMKEALLQQVLSEYDIQFRDLEKTENKKANKVKISSLPKSITACKRMTIPEALKDILRNYSWAKILTPEQLKYHVIAGYRDQAGKKFKNNSVYHAIRRGGYGNNIE